VAVVRHLAALQDAGRLGSEQVQLAAGALGVSERTVWRWVRQACSGEGLVGLIAAGTGARTVPGSPLPRADPGGLDTLAWPPPDVAAGEADRSPGRCYAQS
jgi:hypothetical protein